MNINEWNPPFKAIFCTIIALDKTMGDLSILTSYITDNETMIEYIKSIDRLLKQDFSESHKFFKSEYSYKNRLLVPLLKENGYELTYHYVNTKQGVPISKINSFFSIDKDIRSSIEEEFMNDPNVNDLLFANSIVNYIIVNSDNLPFPEEDYLKLCYRLDQRKTNFASISNVMDFYNADKIDVAKRLLLTRVIYFEDNVADNINTANYYYDVYRENLSHYQRYFGGTEEGLKNDIEMLRQQLKEEERQLEV